MPDTVKPYHEILDIQCSDTTPWLAGGRTVDISALLGIPAGKKVAMQVDAVCDGGERVTLLPLTAYTDETVRKYSIKNATFAAGVNTVFVLFVDELPPEDGNGTTEFQCEVVGETRDAFTVQRKFSFKKEYLVSGSVQIDRENGLEVSAVSGREEGFAIPVKAIQMDGRAKIYKITVNGDEDALTDVQKKYSAAYRVDRGNDILQQFPLTHELQNYKAIVKVRMADAV